MNKIILNFNVPMRNSRREVMKVPVDMNDEAAGVKDYMLNENLSSILFNMTRGEIQKYSKWSDILFDGGALELDKADTDKLRKLIEDFAPNAQGEGGMAIGIKQQYFDIIDDAIDLAKSEKKKEQIAAVPAAGGGEVIEG